MTLTYAHMRKEHVLIDTWWNVNLSTVIDLNTSLKVLIDTWWNVNVLYVHYFFIIVLVLIDTWWNVNN